MPRRRRFPSAYLMADPDRDYIERLRHLRNRAMTPLRPQPVFRPYLALPPHLDFTSWLTFTHIPRLISLGFSEPVAGAMAEEAWLDWQDRQAEKLVASRSSSSRMEP